MILQPAGLDAIEIDALQTDRYLDALLSAGERRANDVPADPAIDPTLRLAARRLRDELVRTHPLFRFEERLARRLADAAARMQLANATGGEAQAAVIPFPAPALAPAVVDPALAAELANRELAALLGAAAAAAAADTDAASAGTVPQPLRPASAVARPLLVGGALTSAALSLAGAAFVAWRRRRLA